MTARRKRLIAVWAAFAVLLALIIVLETQEPHDHHGHGTDGHADLAMFRFTEGELGGLDAFFLGKVASLLRDPDGRWFHHGGSHRHGAEGTAPAGEIHKATQADEARIAEQMRVTSHMKADRSVPHAKGLEAYGLANPPMIFMFHGRDGNKVDYSTPLSVLHVGDLEPTEYAYYARRQGDKVISLVPRFQVSLLLTLTHGADAAPTLEPKPATAPADNSPRR